MSSSLASGTKSRISGERLSVLLPRRMVAICVSDPIGLERPRRTFSTPAMRVVATAPRPGVRMPILPVAGRIVGGVERLSVVGVPGTCFSYLAAAGGATPAEPGRALRRSELQPTLAAYAVGRL